ncbi:RDD family protein [Saprospira sp. CCB-QB6]|uniref:RDD family protein n=1 Tax=Saprospira sp. CCB-QB6 TaxID=3023936 RepID=UPI00234A5777|nr:RDD family protein [Saprospira sp. CCB-QB6]WCL81273.1 RDD family protein [Saprospira sp. CCB-QB6]
MNKKVDITPRLMTFTIDSLVIIVFSFILIGILEQIRLFPYTSVGQQIQELLPQKDFLYWWCLQLAIALSYHYVAWSVWNASPAQRIARLKLVDAQGENLSFFRFLARLLLKAAIINIPLFLFIYDRDFFILSSLIYLGTLIIASKMIYENPKGQMFHDLLTNSHFVYLPEKKKR